jgi:pyrroline-5-carboxylate reductase
VDDGPVDDDLTVGIVGVGRMGRALAARIGLDREPIMVSRRAGLLEFADGRTLAFGADPSALRDCAVVLLAVPADEVAAALAWVRPHLRADVLLANLATELATPDLDGAGARLIGCKIVGQSGQIERGVRAALVADGASEAERALLTAVLWRIGTVLDGPESLVATVNDRVARYMVAAQSGLASELDGLGLLPAARDAAIGNVAVGVWQAVASGNTGPFLTRIVEELAADS